MAEGVASGSQYYRREIRRTPRFAESEDHQQLGPDTAALEQQRWTLDHDGMGVTKTFHFKSYFKAVVST